MMTPPRVVLHLDMDAFYAAVEVRENPELAGKPLIIGHRGRRGVVSTCSYEARRFGVRSAMPSVRAERLCPGAVWLPGRMALYVEISRAIRAILADFSPVVEPLSIDEAFLDLTGIAGSLAEGAEHAGRLKERVRSEHALTASVGVAANKFLAKVASDMDKPDGLVVLAGDDLPAKFWPLPVTRLWGVGEKTAARLRSHGLETVGDVAAADRERLVAHLGAHLADHLLDLAHGRDARPVVPSRAPKSVSEERTYQHDLTSRESIDRALLARAEGVSRELRRQGLTGRTVHLKVRLGDFTTWTRAHTLETPTDTTEAIVAVARRLLATRIDLGGRGVRLLGVGVSGLAPRESEQTNLFDAPGDARRRKLIDVLDALHAKHGDRAPVRARLLPDPASDARDDDEASSLPTVD